jgi:hypothetical protein
MQPIHSSGITQQEIAIAHITDPGVGNYPALKLGSGPFFMTCLPPV